LDESIASRAKRKRLPWQQDCNPQVASWEKTKGLPCELDFVADGLGVPLADRKGSSCQQYGTSQSCEVHVYSKPNLPEVRHKKLFSVAIHYSFSGFLDIQMNSLAPLSVHVYLFLFATLACFYFLPCCCTTKTSFHASWLTKYTLNNIC
jgi:hypothetical protein